MYVVPASCRGTTTVSKLKNELLQTSASVAIFLHPLSTRMMKRSARGEQIAKRPAFKRLLEDVEAGRVQVIIVHMLDRWSRNVHGGPFRVFAFSRCTRLRSFRFPSILITQHQKGDFNSLSWPHSPLTFPICSPSIRAKGRVSVQRKDCTNGDVPFGYRRTGPKQPPEPDPKNFAGLRLIGELRMKRSRGGKNCRRAE